MTDFHQYKNNTKLNDKKFFIVLGVFGVLFLLVILRISVDDKELEDKHYQIASKKSIVFIDSAGNQNPIRLIDKESDTIKKIEFIFLDKLFSISNKNLAERKDYLMKYTESNMRDSVIKTITGLYEEAYFHGGKYSLFIADTHITPEKTYYLASLSVETINEKHDKGNWIVEIKTKKTYPTVENQIGIMVTHFDIYPQNKAEYSGEDVEWYQMK
jgi:hypothetical protein